MCRAVVQLCSLARHPRAVTGSASSCLPTLTYGILLIYVTSAAIYSHWRHVDVDGDMFTCVSATHIQRRSSDICMEEWAMKVIDALKDATCWPYIVPVTRPVYLHSAHAMVFDVLLLYPVKLLRSEFHKSRREEAGGEWRQKWRVEGVEIGSEE